MDRFTDDQIREIHEAFLMHDKKDTGFLRTTEVRETLRILGMNPTDDQVERFLVTTDHNNDEQLSFEEFLRLVSELESDEKSTVEAWSAFNAFDFMNRGYVAAHDLKAALLYVTEKAPEHERNDVIKFLKLERNRKIFFREFRDMITIQRR